jgi:hypothetical protein
LVSHCVRECEPSSVWRDGEVAMENAVWVDHDRSEIGEKAAGRLVAAGRD